MSDGWNLPWDGGCRCGAVRLRVTKPPLLSGACHCTGCRRMTGSAYSLSLSLPAAGLEIARGEPVPGGLRGPDAHHFHCPDCKSWLFTRAEGFDFFVNLRATMLDDHGWFAPYVELWTREKLPWASTGAPHGFETVPGMSVFEPLMKSYSAEGARPGA